MYLHLSFIIVTIVQCHFHVLIRTTSIQSNPIQFQAQNNMRIDTGVKLYCDNSSFAHYYSSFVLDCSAYIAFYAEYNSTIINMLILLLFTKVFISFWFVIGSKTFFFISLSHSFFKEFSGTVADAVCHNAICSNWIVAKFIHILHSHSV